MVQSGKRPLRAGVVGAGVFGGHHARKYLDSAQAELVGIYDTEPARAQRLADALDVPAFATLDCLLDCADAVSITAPASTHADLVGDALSHGCHVYVEKPLACTARDAYQLVARAEQAGLTLGAGHQERFVFSALGALDVGARPHHIVTRRHNPWSGRGTDVSVVLDLMIHDLDLVSAAFDGARLIGVDAGPLRSGVDTDHAVEAHLSFEGGRTAVLTVDRFAPVQNRTTQLDYADGSLAIDFANRTVNSTRTGVAPGRFDTDDARLSDPLGYGVEAFLTAASGIAGPRPVTGRDAAYAVDLAEQVDAALMALRQTA